MGLQKIINAVCARLHTLIMLHQFINSDHYTWDGRMGDRSGTRQEKRGGHSKMTPANAPRSEMGDMGGASKAGVPTSSAQKIPSKTVSRRTQVRVRKDTKKYVTNLKMRRGLIQAENDFELYAEGFDKKDIYGTPAFIWLAANAE